MDNRDYRYTAVTKDRIKPGMLLRRTWGATMRGHDFYQVIEVTGSRVKLGVPVCQATGNQVGEQWIERADENPEFVRCAKFTTSGLMLCHKPGEKDWREKDVSWKVESGWPSLYEQQAGEREHFYGD